MSLPPVGGWLECRLTASLCDSAADTHVTKPTEDPVFKQTLQTLTPPKDQKQDISDSSCLRDRGSRCSQQYSLEEVETVVCCLAANFDWRA